MINLDGVFGKTEMEYAAGRIIEKCQENKTWSTKVSYQDMEENNNGKWCSYEQYGFLLLLHHGYMYYMSGRGFFPGKDFINRIKEDRPGVVNLSGDGTYESIYPHAFPGF